MHCAWLVSVFVGYCLFLNNCWVSFFYQKFLRSHKLSLSFFEKNPSIINFRIKIINPIINLTDYILNNNPLLCVRVGC
jgi:hypothetical protein